MASGLLLAEQNCRLGLQPSNAHLSCREGVRKVPVFTLPGQVKHCFSAAGAGLGC